STQEVAAWTRSAVAGLASVRPGRGYDFAYSTKALMTAACGTRVLFAGAGPVADIVARQDLGWSVPWDVEAVADAMREALQQPGGVLADEQAAWVVDRHSSRAVAARAVDVIDAVVRSRSTRPDSGD